MVNVTFNFFSSRPNEKKKRTKNLIFQTQKYEENLPDLKPGISRSSVDTSETIISDESIKIEQEVEGTTSAASEFIEAPIANNTHISENVKNEETVATTTTEPSEETSIDFTQKIGIEGKIDLYKAVFLSSSESEDETEDQNNETEAEQNKIEEFKSAILSEPLLPQIKPIKEGILSGINFRDFNMNRNKVQIEVKPEHKSEETTDLNVPKNPLLYGPQVPLPRSENKCISNVKQSFVISSDSEDGWVEKDGSDTKKKSKHKKKDKKQKHKKHKKKDKKQEKR